MLTEQRKTFGAALGEGGLIGLAGILPERASNEQCRNSSIQSSSHTRSHTN